MKVARDFKVPEALANARSTLPPGVHSIDDLSFRRHASGRGYVITVRGRATSGGVKVELGEPRVEDVRVTVTLRTSSFGGIGTTALKRFALEAFVARAPQTPLRTFTINLVNPAGELIDQRLVTLSRS